MINYEDGVVLRKEFTHYPYERIEPFKIVEGIQVDGMTDILANKLMSLTDRKEIKDYVDIYFILKERDEISVMAAIKKTEKKFGINGLLYILQGRFLEFPGEVDRLRMIKYCEDKELVEAYET